MGGKGWQGVARGDSLWVVRQGVTITKGETMAEFLSIFSTEDIDALTGYAVPRPPRREGDGITWTARVERDGGVYRVNRVLFPTGARRYHVTKFNGYVGGEKFGCAWDSLGFLEVPVDADELPVTPDMIRAALMVSEWCKVYADHDRCRTFDCGCDCHAENGVTAFDVLSGAGAPEDNARTCEIFDDRRGLLLSRGPYTSDAFRRARDNAIRHGCANLVVIFTE